LPERACESDPAGQLMHTPLPERLYVLTGQTAVDRSATLPRVHARVRHTAGHAAGPLLCHVLLQSPPAALYLPATHAAQPATRSTDKLGPLRQYVGSRQAYRKACPAASRGKRATARTFARVGNTVAVGAGRARCARRTGRGSTHGRLRILVSWTVNSGRTMTSAEPRRTGAACVADGAASVVVDCTE